MGKKTEPKKLAAPAKRAAKSPPAAEKISLPEPPAPVAPKAKKPVTPAAKPIEKPVAKPAAAQPKKAAAPAKSKVAKVAKPKPAYTHDDIALRAYFIAERRQKTGHSGDAAGDWIAAERELAAEAKKAKASKAKPR